ncbi:sensor histidine kinase [Streptosporangium sp. CA-135522]|uniref:sensor histidine kinase n=1 Tax=Streptosporangium sp. CA-135522 TaxID=3240072 RepID=UPI003D8D4EF3
MTGRSRDALFDAVITTGVCAATVLPLAGAPWRVVVVAVLASAPVFWRRRAPLTVMLVVGLATTALALLEAVPRLPYGALVCVYTLAVLSPPVLLGLAVAITAAGVVVSFVIPREALADFGFVSAAYVVAVALGMSARAHRAQVATLRERARRQEEEAAARERLAIARDMHDILTHSVGIMVVQAEAGPLVMRTDPARAEAAFDAIAETGRGAIVQLRRVLGTLRSGDGARPGVDSLPDLIARSRRTGLEVRLEEEGRRRALPADVDVALYRVVQESLTNTIKHAVAREVLVRLRWADTTLRLEVSDDGRGPQPGGSGGHGMIGMRERVLACGGTLRAGPGPAGAGFAVFATFPIG